jgi:predicted DNA-binding ribbon-helix-helix protein
MKSAVTMKSPVIKRSIVIGSHKTSISLEDEFWYALKDIAKVRGMTLSKLVEGIDYDREHSNLSSTLRLFVLAFYRDAVASRVGNLEQEIAA